MSDREAFYDANISPVLLELMESCRREGLSMVAFVEWAPGAGGRSVCLQPGSSIGVRLVELARQANGNVDALILAIMRHATKHGHSSLCLAQLGIPPSPVEGVSVPPGEGATLQ